MRLILTHPDPVLRQESRPVDPKSDADLPELIEDMAEAMYEAPGVGLAAPQIGIQKSVIIFDLEKQLYVLCNPRVVEMSEEKATEEEGCLSVPGINVPVERPLNIVVEALSPKGDEVRLEADAYLARVLQHEIDHLNGVLIIDRATPEERRAALRRYMSETG